MTNEIKLEVTCVHCLGVGEKQLYPIINRQDLEAKQNIFEEDFLEYLSNFQFTGDIYAIPEGTVVFPREPLVKGFRMNVCIMMRN